MFWIFKWNDSENDLMGFRSFQKVNWEKTLQLIFSNLTLLWFYILIQSITSLSKVWWYLSILITTNYGSYKCFISHAMIFRARAWNYSPETENMMLLLVFGAVSKQTNVTKLFMMKEHVTQCSGVTHWRVFNSFWTTTEESDISGFDTHTILVSRSVHCWFGSSVLN